MTPIEVTRKMLGHLDLSESQLTQVRDLVDIQADIVVRGFWERHKEHYDQLFKDNHPEGDSDYVSAARVVSDTSGQGEETTGEMDGISKASPHK